MILLRRVVGESMLPTLRPGQVVVAHRLVRRLKPGHVVIIRHNGMEKIKRIASIEAGQLLVLGDNLTESTDSRHFGRLPLSAVLARVVWPIR